MLLLQACQEIFSVIVELRKITWRISESSLKIVSSPLNSMFNLIGEVLQGAKWNAFLRRIDDVSVADGCMRNNDLRVAFSSKSSWFEKRFFKPNALTVNILSCLNIINCIDNEIKIGPEIIIENVFVFRSNSGLQGFEVDIRVHFLSYSTSSFTFILTYVLSSEQELSVKVADFNIIIISNC